MYRPSIHLPRGYILPCLPHFLGLFLSMEDRGGEPQDRSSSSQHDHRLQTDLTALGALDYGVGQVDITTDHWVDFIAAAHITTNGDREKAGEGAERTRTQKTCLTTPQIPTSQVMRTTRRSTEDKLMEHQEVLGPGEDSEAGSILHSSSWPRWSFPQATFLEGPLLGEGVGQRKGGASSQSFREATCRDLPDKKVSRLKSLVPDKLSSLRQCTEGRSIKGFESYSCHSKHASKVGYSINEDANKSSWTAGSPCCKLATSNQGPMDSKHSKGLPNSIHLPALSESHTPVNSV